MKIIVIGGGPGGYVAAIRAAQLGGEVTLIERNLLGGTCLNEGCIPTKAILHVSELLEQIRDGSQWGVRVDAPYIEWKQVQEKKKKIVKQLTSGVAGLLRANKVKVISGTAAFVDARTLEVRVPNGKAKRIKGDKIIVAAGSVPAIPPISGIKDTPACMDSTEALALSEVPGSLLVIGGGVVGMELAAAYHALGSRVTVIESMTRLLPMIDGELSSLYQSIIQKKGIEVYTNTRAKSIEQMGDGACVSVEKNDGDAQFIVDKVLIATGRRANTTGLNLDAAGILHDHGRIVANSKMETSVPGIYVAGDCLGQVMLAHTASRQGEIAAENAMGKNSRYEGRTSPSCIYTMPETASVGLTEEEAVQENIPINISRFPLAANGKALIMGGEEGMIKLIFGKEFGEILGAHIIGPRATDMIGELALAIGLEVMADELITTIHAHPTLSEAIRECAMGAQNRAIHIMNR